MTSKDNRPIHAGPDGARADPAGALYAVAAAAALRSEAALWRALEEALAAGASWEELEGAIRAAARISEAAVQLDGLRTLREVRARQGAKERWGIKNES